jgi:hypothetical protein
MLLDCELARCCDAGVVNLDLIDRFSGRRECKRGKSITNQAEQAYPLLVGLQCNTIHLFQRLAANGVPNS